MAWRLRFHPAVSKDLRRLSSERRTRLLETVLPSLADHPYHGEPLHGPLKGFWKYRAGAHRIAYAIDVGRQEVLVLEIGPRGGFYERLRKRLRK